MATVFNVAINNKMQRGQVEELMRCHRSFRPIRSHHRTLAKQRTSALQQCATGTTRRVRENIVKATITDLLSQDKLRPEQGDPSLLFMEMLFIYGLSKPTFFSEVLMQLMSDNPLPVYLNYRSLPPLFLSLSLGPRKQTAQNVVDMFG